jgi:hypothetical protein
MLRFIIKAKFKYTSGVEGEYIYSIDHDVYRLEESLSRGGHGESEYELHELLGVEIIPDRAGKDVREQQRPALAGSKCQITGGYANV